MNAFCALEEASLASCTIVFRGELDDELSMEIKFSHDKLLRRRRQWSLINFSVSENNSLSCRLEFSWSYVALNVHEETSSCSGFTFRRKNLMRKREANNQFRQFSNWIRQSFRRKILKPNYLINSIHGGSLCLCEKTSSNLLHPICIILRDEPLLMTHFQMQMLIDGGSFQGLRCSPRSGAFAF